MTYPATIGWSGISSVSHLPRRRRPIKVLILPAHGRGVLGWQIGGQLEREDVPRDLGCVSFITINISCVAVAAADHLVARLIVRGKTDSFMGG